MTENAATSAINSLVIPLTSATDRRAHILASAMAVFTHKGYHNTSMDDVAARAEISKPIVYQHFAGKRELYLGLLDDSVDAVIEGVAHAMSQASNGRDRLTAAIRYYFDAVETADHSFRLIFETDFTRDPDVQTRIDSLIAGLARIVGIEITEATGLPASEANLLAAGLCGMAQASAFRWIRLGRPTSLEDAVIAISNLGWNGISAVSVD